MMNELSKCLWAVMSFFRHACCFSLPVAREGNSCVWNWNFCRWQSSSKLNDYGEKCRINEGYLSIVAIVQSSYCDLSCLKNLTHFNVVLNSINQGCCSKRKLKVNNLGSTKWTIGPFAVSLQGSSLGLVLRRPSLISSNAHKITKQKTSALTKSPLFSISIF